MLWVTEAMFSLGDVENIEGCLAMRNILDGRVCLLRSVPFARGRSHTGSVSRHAPTAEVRSVDENQAPRSDEHPEDRARRVWAENRELHAEGIRASTPGLREHREYTTPALNVSVETEAEIDMGSLNESFLVEPWYDRPACDFLPNLAARSTGAL